MDRSLDEVIANRQQGQRGQRGFRGRRPNPFPRDGVRKSNNRDTRDLDQDWVHDRFDDDEEARPRRGGGFRSDRTERANPAPAARTSESGFKLKVENLHYEISEDDLRELFSRIGRVTTVSLVYDRQDRSTGVAYVSYAHLEDALKALNDFNGQNAYDQPIYLTMLPSKDGSTPQASTRRNNPTDTNRPSRSLFDRIENPPPARRGRGRDQRSLSPEGPIRHSDVSKPAPEHIDRYVPGQRDNSRRRSPLRRGGPGGGRGAHGRRPGARREQGRRDDQGRQIVQGRPRKTQEELDAEMDDYWNQGDAPAPNTASNGNGPATKPAGGAGGDDDIDMVE